MGQRIRTKEMKSQTMRQLQLTQLFNIIHSKVLLLILCHFPCYHGECWSYRKLWTTLQCEKQKMVQKMVHENHFKETLKASLNLMTHPVTAYINVNLAGCSKWASWLDGPAKHFFEGPIWHQRTTKQKCYYISTRKFLLLAKLTEISLLKAQRPHDIWIHNTVNRPMTW